MQTGIKAVDQLLAKHGILTAVGGDQFQKRARLTGGDSRANTLPFCMYQKVAYAPLSQNFTVHHFFMPGNKGKLASFLFDDKGALIEQVYYQKVSRWVQVCRKLQQLVQATHNGMHLAA